MIRCKYKKGLKYLGDAYYCDEKKVEIFKKNDKVSKELDDIFEKL